MSAAEDHQLLDLNFLDEEEKLQIEAVLKRSYEEIKKEENRLNKLQEEIDARNEQVRLHVSANGGRSCPMCEQPFGIIFSTGARCPECFRKVCKQCRVPPQATRNFICTLCEKKSILRLGRSRTLKYETATPAEDEDIFGTNLVMKSLKNLQKFNEEFPLSGLTRVMTLPTKRGENKGAGPRRMSGLLRQSKRHSKPDLHDREGTTPTTGKEPPSVTSEGEVPTERHKEAGEVPTAMCEEPPDLLLPAFERRDSLASAFSTYSGAEAKGDYSITGEVLFGLEYHSGQLLVHVVGARGLAAADKGGSSDPYVKTYLLPDKKKESKKKTKVVKKTLNPTFNETLKYEVSESSLLGRTLWLSVWDWDRFGRNQFLGEVRVALKEFDLSTYTERWYLLNDKVSGAEATIMDAPAMPIPQAKFPMIGQDLLHAGSVSSLGSVYSTLPEKGDYSITGEVLFGLEYHSGQLLVHVVGARGLAAADKGGSSNPYVKTYLLPDKKKENKKKTKVVKKTLNPTFNETLKYKVPNSGLEKRTLCLSVWDDNFGRNKFLGQVKVPLSEVDLSQRRDRWMTLMEK